ncbi:MAG: hypothetical protein O3B13_24545 [Planctomycetota bacterium]|nr:hypothetical protein [Planctomycetota bacterium]
MSWSDPTKLKRVKEFGISGIAFCVARTSGTGQLFFGNSDFKVYEVDALAETPAPAAFEAEGHQSYVTGIVSNQKTVVSGSYDGNLIWWDAQSKKPTRSIKAHDRWIRKISASPDGSVVASIADDMVGKLWDAESGQLIHTLQDHQLETPNHYPSMLYAVAFSPDGKWLATADKVGHIVIWEVASGKKAAQLEAPGMYTWDPRARRHSIGGVRSVAFSHDSQRLAAGGIGHIGNIDHLGGPSRVEVFDWQKGERIHEIEDTKLQGLVERLEFDPQGNWLVAAGGDNGGFVTFYRAETGKLIHQDKAPMHVHEFVMNDDSTGLFAVGHGRIAHYEFKSDYPPGPAEPPLPEDVA